MRTRWIPSSTYSLWPYSSINLTHSVILKPPIDANIPQRSNWQPTDYCKCSLSIQFELYHISLPRDQRRRCQQDSSCANRTHLVPPELNSSQFLRFLLNSIQRHVSCFFILRPFSCKHHSRHHMDSLIAGDSLIHPGHCLCSRAFSAWFV